MSTIIVIGVGHTLRGDDGAGPAVVHRLREHGLPGAVLATSFGETADLLGLWDGKELAIVVDAMRAWPAHPGRVHRLVVGPGAPERARAASSHGIDLGETVELARELGRLPERLIIYGIEAADVGFGSTMSPAVRKAVEHLADEITVTVWAAQQPTAVPA